MPNLPGIDLSLSHIPEECFPYIELSSYLNDFGRGGDPDNEEVPFEHPVLTLRELEMLRAMNEITDKVNWERKIFDADISAKWKQELMSTKTALDVGFSEAMADWCIDELRYTAETFTTSIPIFNGLVQKSDTVIPCEVRDALKAAVVPLENVPPKMQDWHPGSDGKVLDLVHPSLYPLVYGLTKITDHGKVTLENCLEIAGEGTTIRKNSRAPQDGFSQKFQWLPCNVKFLENGQTQITSYINNLHPKKHAALYPIISDIISRCIPLWNETLTAAQSPKRVRVVYRGYQYEFTREEIEVASKRRRIDPDPEPFEEEGESWDDYAKRHTAWEHREYPVIQPEPLEKFSPNWRENPPERIGPHWYGNATWRRRLYPHLKEQSIYTPPTPVDLKAQFAKEGIQVIVKLANIQLTPEKPEYAGGTWHIEGKMNEHICASAIYYYDNDNITDSSLAFRYRCPPGMTIYYPQNIHHWFLHVYGLKEHDRLTQRFGSVKTTEGRLVTFANILQHQVQPFELADRTKPGHRKILALFLVDPHIRIVSTADVPCQQREWWRDASLEGMTGGLHCLPTELKEEIFSYANFPIPISRAKRLRLELMEERKFDKEEQLDGFEDFGFALCEH